MLQYRSLTSQIQELQDMSDAGEFQDTESNKKQAVVPSPRSMLSRDRRMPFQTWKMSETQGNVFGNPRPMFGSSQTPYLRILHTTTPSATSDSSAGKHRATCREI